MDSDCQCQRAGPKNFHAPNTPLYGEICSQTETVAAVVDIFVGDANTGTISEIAQGVIGFEHPTPWWLPQQVQQIIVGEAPYVI